MHNLLLYQPADEEDVHDFDFGTGKGPANKIQLYFGKGWKKSLWNSQIIEQLINF